MEMFDPPHAGEIIREACLEPLGLTVTAAARWLGVSRQSLSELLNGRAGVSAEMAIRLEKAFGSTAETWLRAQLKHDLWQARRRSKTIKVRRYPAPEASLARESSGS
jgi:addiction module HigA family antidote